MQCTAVIIHPELRIEPPQLCPPFLLIDTMYGKSAMAASVPFTTFEDFCSGTIEAEATLIKRTTLNTPGLIISLEKN